MQSLTEKRTELTLRKATAADVARLEKLVQDAYRGGRSTVDWKNEDHLVQGPRTTAEELAQLIGSADAAILIFETHLYEMAGCVMVENHSCGEGHIGLLAVNPDLQNCGVGGRLLSAAESYAVKHYESHTGVMWVLSNRDELLHWYCSKGYELTEEQEPFPGPETGLVQLAQNLYFRVVRKSLR